MVESVAGCNTTSHIREGSSSWLRAFTSDWPVKSGEATRGRTKDMLFCRADEVGLLLLREHSSMWRYEIMA